MIATVPTTNLPILPPELFKFDPNKETVYAILAEYGRLIQSGSDQKLKVRVRACDKSQKASSTCLELFLNCSRLNSSISIIKADYFLHNSMGIFMKIESDFVDKKYKQQAISSKLLKEVMEEIFSNNAFQATLSDLYQTECQVEKFNR